MNSCLVTKLKGVVDNDNLEKLNHLTVTAPVITAGGASKTFNLSGTNILIKEGTVYSDSTLQTVYGTTGDTVAGKYLYYARGEQVIMEIQDVFGCTYLMGAFPEINNDTVVKFVNANMELGNFFNLSGDMESKIAKMADFIHTPDKTHLRTYIMTGSLLTFNGSIVGGGVIGAGGLYLDRDETTNIITVYGTREGTSVAYTYSDVVGIYNINTNTWSYPNS